MRDRRGRGRRGIDALPGPLSPHGLPSRRVPRDDFEALVTTIVTERMGHAADLRVPLSVQIGIGSNWDEAAH